MEYSIGDFAERINISIPSLRNMHKDGRLVPYRVTKGGHRVYTEEQALEYIRQTMSKEYKSSKRNVVGYCRSTNNKEDKIKKEKLTKYIHNKGVKAQIIVEHEEFYKYSLLKDIVSKILNDEIKELVLLDEADIYRGIRDIFNQILEIKGCKLIILE